jgi:hypothetical protein
MALEAGASDIEGGDTPWLEGVARVRSFNTIDRQDKENS